MTTFSKIAGKSLDWMLAERADINGHLVALDNAIAEARGVCTLRGLVYDFALETVRERGPSTARDIADRYIARGSTCSRSTIVAYISALRCAGGLVVIFGAGHAGSPFVLGLPEVQDEKA